MVSRTSLSFKSHELSNPVFQRSVLNSDRTGVIPAFRDRLDGSGHYPLMPLALDTLQVNLGKMCNQTCRHCHVDAGPDRKEIMERSTMAQCLEALEAGPFKTLDLTGGAPELNPDFKWLVIKAAPLVEKIIVRSNLTIIESNKQYHDLPLFFGDHKVEVVSSLPFYNQKRTDAQRGDGVFAASIKALKRLNKAGYGNSDEGLQLNLVYNPAGSFLPGNQVSLENEFKQRLLKDHGIRFNRLFTITNMPVSRFLEYLLRSGNLEDYMERLAASYNPAAAEGVMCRNILSVGWDGFLYDCDFNQMLDMKLKGIGHIGKFDTKELLQREIRTDQHCYGCTAGCGSSCGGTIEKT